MIKVTPEMIAAGMAVARFERGHDTLIYLTKYPQHQDQLFEMIYRAMRRLEPAKTGVAAQ
jgi:hypothetical protein